MEENKKTTHDPLEALKARMRSGENSSAKIKENNTALPTEENDNRNKKTEVADLPLKEKKTEKENTRQNSLLEKMRRYTVDEEGHDASKDTEPAYRLQTVTEILKSGNEKAIANLTKNPNIQVDSIINLSEEIEEQPENNINDTKVIKEDLNEKPNEEKNNSAEKSDVSQKVGYISDIDKEPDSLVNEKPADEHTATIRFTPVKGGTVNVSSMTKPINIVDTIPDRINKNISDEDEYDEDFNNFNPENEITDEKSLKNLLILFAKKKRNSFVFTFISFVFTIVLAFFLTSKSPNMLICAILYGIVFALNINMFTAFSKFFTKRCSSDVIAAFSAVSTLALSIMSAVKKETHVLPCIIAGAFILCLRSAMSFYESASLFGNLRVIFSKNQKKNAVCLISDNSTTLAMAKNSIEGDVLIAGSKKVTAVTDFMKYSKFSNKLSGKITLISLITLAVGIIFGGVSAALQHNATVGLFAASAVFSFAALPVLFFIDTLPVKSASKKLNSSGSMITGTAAAQRLDRANAVVVSTADIFPAGAITLVNMKVLSEINVDEVLLRAASLTEAVNSPLSPIFKKIVGTSEDYVIPASDTVKYEELLGVSGWVNDELLFIGNRTLLESHGISVPDVKLDHKILADGYFPIYVAKDNKPCVLIVAKYSVKPEIAKKLQKITELGITLLVENSDPNIVKKLICDYFDLYEDTVTVMSSAGVKMYKSATAPKEVTSSPAVYKRSGMGLLDIMYAASRIRKSNLLLTVMYSVLSVFGLIYFIYTSFTDGGVSLSKAMFILLYILITTVVSRLVYLIKKP